MRLLSANRMTNVFLGVCFFFCNKGLRRFQTSSGYLNDLTLISSVYSILCVYKKVFEQALYICKTVEGTIP